jgi:hypothetical protein
MTEILPSPHLLSERWRTSVYRKRKFLYDIVRIANDFDALSVLILQIYYISLYSKVTGGGFIVRETACKYLRTSLKSVQNAVKIRVWETASTLLLAFRHGLYSELPLFYLVGVMSNLAFISKRCGN